MQRSWALHLVLIERLGGIFHTVGSPGERKGRGDERRGNARAAERAPVEHVLHFGFFVAVFTFRARVVDGNPGVGVRVRGDVRDSTFGAAADPRPVGHALLPGLRGKHHAAAAARRAIAVPHGLARPCAAHSKTEARAAHRDHVRRGRGEVGVAPFTFFFGIPVEVAVVARSRRDHDALVVERARALQFRSLAHLGARPGVRDLARAERGGTLLGRFEVFIGRRVGLHEQDVAALTGRVRDLDVERDLNPPTGRFFGLFACRPRAFARRFQFFRGLRERRVAGFAVLVDLPEAAIARGARGQSEFFVVGFQIRFGGRIVVGIDQRHRLRGGCAGRQLVGGVQILRSQTKRPRARRRRRQRRAAREPERVLASTSRSGSRHELQCQAPAPPTSGPRAHGTDGVVRARQRRDAARAPRCRGRHGEQAQRDQREAKTGCADASSRSLACVASIDPSGLHEPHQSYQREASCSRTRRRPHR